MYSINHKRVFTPLGDLWTLIIEVINHFSNSTTAFAFTKNPRIFCKCKCHCWAGIMIDKTYYSGQKILGRFETSFVNYEIHYQKLYDLMRQITSLQQILTDPLYVCSSLKHCFLCFKLNQKWYLFFLYIE